MSSKARDALGWVAVIAVAAAVGWFAGRGPEAPGPGASPGPGPRPTPRDEPAPVTKRSLGLRLTQDDQGRVVIEEALAGGHGAAAGLAAGEVILAVEGQPLSEFQPLFDRLAALGPDAPLRLEVEGEAGRREVLVRFEGEGYELKFARRLIREAVEQLLQARRADGLWPHYQDPERPSVAVSALVAYALARAVPELEPAQRVELGVLTRSLLERRGEDGGLVDPAQLVAHRVYATSLLLLALSEPGAASSEAVDPEAVDPEAARGLARWLARSQVQEARGYDPIDTRYGGWSYYDRYASPSLRTDVSTARFALQALDQAGWPDADLVWQRAGLYLDLTQNHALLTGADDPLRRQELPLRDGGFAFTPRMSKAGEAPLGDELLTFRSYGSATADGLVALLATRGIDRRGEGGSAGAAPSPGGQELTPDVASDERVLAALRWLARGYTLARNPGFGEDPVGWGQGLFFYYAAALAEGLHRAGVWRVLGADGEAHPWASELVRRLGDLHGRRGGRFASESGLMHEDRPTIAAAFAILALSAARDRLALGGGGDLRASAPPERAPLLVTAPPPQPADAVARGQAAFRELGCAACHRDGEAANAPSLVGIGDEYVGALGSEARARARFAAHVRRPQEVPGLLGGEYAARMPAFEPARLPDERLADLVAFLLSRSGERPVSEAR